MVSVVLSELVPVNTVEVVKDDVRQLLHLQVEEQSGIKLRANSISDGTLRFLALAAVTEAVDENGVFCMEEPENGIHPAKLEAMHRLLHEIAVDVDELVDLENPLRQVVVATHSPYFVQLQDKADLVLAKPRMNRSDAGVLMEHLLQCQPYQGTWRCGDEREGMNLLSLQSYLIPPQTAQIAFPRGVLGIHMVTRFLLVCEGNSDAPSGISHTAIVRQHRSRAARLPRNFPWSAIDR